MGKDGREGKRGRVTCMRDEIRPDEWADGYQNNGESEGGPHEY
jgi:hypothetical protein